MYGQWSNIRRTNVRQMFQGTAEEWNNHAHFCPTSTLVLYDQTYRSPSKQASYHETKDLFLSNGTELVLQFCSCCAGWTSSISTEEKVSDSQRNSQFQVTSYPTLLATVLLVLVLYV